MRNGELFITLRRFSEVIIIITMFHIIKMAIEQYCIACAKVYK